MSKREKNQARESRFQGEALSHKPAEAELDILILDSHDLVRQAIGHVLAEASFGKVRTCATLESDESSKDPDVIVVDPLFLGPTSGAWMIVAEIRRRYRRSQILVLSHGESPVDVQRCLSAGAQGYLPKRASGFDLVDAIRRIARGEEYLQPSLGAQLAKGSASPGTASDRVLNKTEQEVLRMLALGHTNAEASKLLNYGVRTVEGYRSKIMKKLGLSTRADMVRAATELGLLGSGDHSAHATSPEWSHLKMATSRSEISDSPHRQ